MVTVIQNLCIYILYDLLRRHILYIQLKKEFKYNKSKISTYQFCDKPFLLTGYFFTNANIPIIAVDVKIILYDMAVLKL